MSKSPDAFRTISEVAEWLGVQPHVLRFWESKFSQVKPVKRAGGRRYSRPDDMALLGGIKVLLHEEGLTIKGAQKLMREKGLRYVMDLAAPVGGGTAEVVEVDVVKPVLIAEAPAPETTGADQPPAETEAPFTEAEPAEEPARILSFPKSAQEDEAVSEPAVSEPVPEPEPDSATAALLGALAGDRPEAAPAEDSRSGSVARRPLLGPLVAAPPEALRARAAELAPLVGRLSSLAGRMSPR